MLRNALAVLAGFLAWTGLFLGLAATIRALFPDAHGPDGSVFATTPLLLYLALDVVASIAAGFAAARIATSHHSRVVWATASLLLLVGLAVQTGSWDLAPTWYNVSFLLILVPFTIWGGRLAGAPRER